MDVANARLLQTWLLARRVVVRYIACRDYALTRVCCLLSDVISLLIERVCVFVFLCSRSLSHSRSLSRRLASPLIDDSLITLLSQKEHYRWHQPRNALSLSLSLSLSSSQSSRRCSLFVVYGLSVTADLAKDQAFNSTRCLRRKKFVSAILLRVRATKNRANRLDERTF